MTKAGRKRQLRQPAATIGRVVRKSGGVVVVDYATSIVDTGAPEYFVTHLCRVEKLGPGTVRISWGSRQEDGTVLVVYKAIMDLTTWLNAQGAIDEARQIVRKLPDGDGRRQGAH